MEKKRCSSCHRHKPVGEFFKNRRMPDGLGNVCKACQKKYTDSWKAAHPDRVRQRSRNSKRDQRAREGDEVTRAKWHEWYEANVEYRRKYQRAQYDPVKRHAQNELNKAVRTGAIVRPDHCSNCGRQCKPDAHHRDYSKPLEVIWLCRRCHRLLQNEPK